MDDDIPLRREYGTWYYAEICIYRMQSVLSNAEALAIALAELQEGRSYEELHTEYYAERNTRMLKVLDEAQAIYQKQETITMDETLKEESHTFFSNLRPWQETLYTVSYILPFLHIHTC